MWLSVVMLMWPMPRRITLFQAALQVILSGELNDQLKLIRFQMREQGYYKQENDYC